jgi:hypothetical protein
MLRLFWVGHEAVTLAGPQTSRKGRGSGRLQATGSTGQLLSARGGSSALHLQGSSSVRLQSVPAGAPSNALSEATLLNHTSGNHGAGNGNAMTSHGGGVTATSPSPPPVSSTAIAIASIPAAEATAGVMSIDDGTTPSRGGSRDVVTPIMHNNIIMEHQNDVALPSSNVTMNASLTIGVDPMDAISSVPVPAPTKYVTSSPAITAVVPSLPSHDSSSGLIATNDHATVVHTL